MVDYREEIFSARWHLDVVRRMMVGFDEYGSKMYLVGAIRELARASGKLVRAFLIMDSTKGNVETFRRRVGLKYLDSGDVGVLVRVLELERGQREARAELLKRDEVLFETGGNWRILKIERLRYFVDVVDKIAREFSTGIKR